MEYKKSDVIVVLYKFGKKVKEERAKGVKSFSLR